jgi:hypothetical protein
MVPFRSRVAYAHHALPSQHQCPRLGQQPALTVRMPAIGSKYNHTDKRNNFSWQFEFATRNCPEGMEELVTTAHDIVLKRRGSPSV